MSPSIFIHVNMCECLCVLSQSLKLLQFIESSSLNITDLVLHQMTAIKKHYIIVHFLSQHKVVKQDVIPIMLLTKTNVYTVDG